MTKLLNLYRVLVAAPAMHEALLAMKAHDEQLNVDERAPDGDDYNEVMSHALTVLKNL